MAGFQVKLEGKSPNSIFILVLSHLFGFENNMFLKLDDFFYSILLPLDVIKIPQVQSFKLSFVLMLLTNVGHQLH